MNLIPRENIQNQKLFQLLNQDEFRNYEIVSICASPDKQLIDLLFENFNQDSLNFLRAHGGFLLNHHKIKI